MAIKKANIYGANEAPESALGASTSINAETYNPAGYPITFGVGEDANSLKTIATKEDGKVRFVYNIKDGEGDATTATNSGAIYVGGNLVSSKIIDIVTNATETADATEVTVKYIGTDGAIETLSFGVVDPELFDELKERVDKLEAWAEDDVITEATGGAITVTPAANEDGFNNYTVAVNVDDETVKVVDDKLAVATYFIDKLGADEEGYSKDYAAQYRLMVQAPGADEPTQAGDTINIMKDFLLKDAHVCVFNKKADGTSYDVTAGSNTVDSVEIYAQVTNSAYADKTVGEGADAIYLEKAPAGKNLLIGHTYLHLILNTNPTDEVVTDDSDKESGNDTTTDVYLDFTEILGAGSFQEMRDDIDDIEKRIEKVEEGYVTSISQAIKGEGSQFDTVTVTTASGKGNDNDSYDTADSAFDIPNQNYYTTVEGNFTTLQNNDTYLAGLLTWGDLA